MDAMKAKLVRDQVPELVRKEDRLLKTLDACSAGMILLALDPKNFDLSARFVVPLEPVSGP
jgi:hypothetical protein